MLERAATIRGHGQCSTGSSWGFFLENLYGGEDVFFDSSFVHRLQNEY